jgi:hypothetical protein
VKRKDKSWQDAAPTIRDRFDRLPSIIDSDGRFITAAPVLVIHTTEIPLVAVFGRSHSRCYNPSPPQLGNFDQQFPTLPIAPVGRFSV